ncbi:MAG: hypothetical protein VB045_07460 [Synergistaceae bacterium]|nr:hypothetical protein [Synergistaceae bacterium]
MTDDIRRRCGKGYHGNSERGLGMKKNVFRTLACFILVAALTAHCTSRAEAWIKITLNNKRSHSIAVAFCWSGFDYPDDQRKGWYLVKPGKSRVITLADVVSSMTMEGFGFYAKGTPKGGNTVVWSGDMKQVIIDPKNAFDGHPEDPIPGGVTVGFQKVTLKKVGDQNTDAVATLSFNP